MDARQPAHIYGRATLFPTTDVTAGAYGTWTLTYTVGKHGVDDGGTILVAHRLASDWGTPQLDRPADPDYTTVTTDGQARLRVWYDPTAYVRPWKAALAIRVYEGALAPGERVVITFGDRRGGSPGSQAQTFAEETYEFRVLVDCFGTGQFVLVPAPPVLRVVGGEACRLRVLAPSQVVVGEPFAVTVKAEDRWGNPSPGYRGQVTLAADEAGVQLPAAYRCGPAERGVHRFTDVVLPRPGVYRLVARDEATRLVAVANPVEALAQPPAHRLYWGDIHGQTETTVGTGTVEEYFAYGRDVAALDFLSHCANDFQITREHYAETQAAVKRYHEPGRFVTLLGYEWSGNTPAGGDHNVYFLHDDQPIHRSSHWQLDDRSDEDSDRYPLTALQETFRGRDDVLIIPHIGGRRANLDYHDPAFAPVIEIYSMHGLFYWFAEEALRRGLRVGFIAGSDDHTGRPGSAFPTRGGGHRFGARGGLLAAYAHGLTREALWEAIKQRRCYGTTGERIVLAVAADGHPMGAEYSTSQPPRLSVRVLGTAPLASVELYRGLSRVYSPPLAPVEAGRRLQVVWRGARVKGRNRETDWDGGLTLAGGRIVAAQPFASARPAEGIVEWSAQHVRWHSRTCGDADGVLLDLEAPGEAVLSFAAGPCQFSLALQELAAGPRLVDAGGVEQQLEVGWAPVQAGPQDVTFTHVDDAIPPGVNPYYVRVTQSDGALAWSSPIFVQYGG